MVNFGINFQLERYSAAQALSTAKYIEELGIHALFVNDHYMKPNGNNILDAYLTLSAIAAQTTRLRIGTVVTPIPFRPAPHLAKMVATLDVISNGRFYFGIGAGWNHVEFDGYGSEFLPPNARVSKTEEGLILMKRLWTEAEVTFQGRYNRIEKGILLPKPIQKPHPPILVGSKSPRMCNLMVKLCDGWIPSFLSPKEYQQSMISIRKAREKHHRDKEKFLFTHNTYIILAEDKKTALKSLPTHQIAVAEKGFIIGSPEECITQLQRYKDIGVDLILLRLYNVIQPKKQIVKIRDEILSQLQ